LSGASNIARVSRKQNIKWNAI